MKKVLLLISSIATCQLAGLAGTVFIGTNTDAWYQSLNKSALTPPGWVFGVVWPVLYTSMGFSLFLIISRQKLGKIPKLALMFFFIQLLLNSVWTPVFFGLKNPQLAFLLIVLLLTAIIATTILFYRINTISAFLLLPYLLWVGFAVYLNLKIVLLN